MVHRDEHSSQGYFHFDRTLNIGNIVGILVLVLTLANYSSQIIHYLKSVDNKVSIMWVDYAATHPEAAQQLAIIEGRNP